MDEFALDYKHDKKIEVIDLWPVHQFKALRLERSVNATLNDLQHTIPEYELHDSVYLVEEDLDETLLAASLAKYHGFQNERVMGSSFSNLQKTQIFWSDQKRSNSFFFNPLLK